MLQYNTVQTCMLSVNDSHSNDEQNFIFITVHSYIAIHTRKYKYDTIIGWKRKKRKEKKETKTEKLKIFITQNAAIYTNSQRINDLFLGKRKSFIPEMFSFLLVSVSFSGIRLFNLIQLVCSFIMISLDVRKKHLFVL